MAAYPTEKHSSVKPASTNVAGTPTPFPIAKATGHRADHTGHRGGRGNDQEHDLRRGQGMPQRRSGRTAHVTVAGVVRISSMASGTPMYGRRTSAMASVHSSARSYRSRAVVSSSLRPGKTS